MKKQILLDNQPIRLSTYLADLYNYRYLILSFIKKDFKVKYTQTKVGYLWILILPIISLVIFSVLFNELLELETGDVPYPAFAFSGMILWFYFTALVNQCGNSIINAQELIKKTYFPKLILPISKFLSISLELLVSLFLLFVLLLMLKVPISITFLYIPFAVLLIGAIGLTIGIWLSLLSVKNRDLIQIIPYLTNYAIWVTPVFYPTSIIPEPYRDIAYYLNPVAVGIDLFRAILFNTSFNYSYLLCILPVLIFLILGLNFFKQKEGNFSDFV